MYLCICFTAVFTALAAANDACAQTPQDAENPPEAQRVIRNIVKRKPDGQTLSTTSESKKHNRAVSQTETEEQPSVVVVRKRKPINPPRNIVTVVHQMDGWKLLAWLMSKGEKELYLDELPANADIHINIVAGYLSEDGRTVVARLPRAEVEVESFVSPPFSKYYMEGSYVPTITDSKFFLISGNGRRIPATFVGLDASTGLSLLEAETPLAVVPKKPVSSLPSPGNFVRMYAPTPANSPYQSADTGAQNAATSSKTLDEGTLYVGIGHIDGQLTDIERTEAGIPLRATVRARRISPESTGAIVTDEEGEFVGIVGDSGDTESQILSAEAIRKAKERVLSRRGSVPRPWLGAKGESVSALSINQLLDRGWSHNYAVPLLSKGRGVLLTKIEKDAPAEEAGLKPGDVITMVGENDVRSAYDFSQLLLDAGSGAKLDFTVMRGSFDAPFKVKAELKESSGFFDQNLKQGLLQSLHNSFGLVTIGLTPRGASNLGSNGGLFILFVRKNSPAEKADLRPGDVIETLNGRSFPPSFWSQTDFDLTDEVTIEVFRQKKRFSLNLSRPSNSANDK